MIWPVCWLVSGPKLKFSPSRFCHCSCFVSSYFLCYIRFFIAFLFNYNKLFQEQFLFLNLPLNDGPVLFGALLYVLMSMFVFLLLLLFLNNDFVRCRFFIFLHSDSVPMLDGRNFIQWNKKNGWKQMNQRQRLVLGPGPQFCLLFASSLSWCPVWFIHSPNDQRKILVSVSIWAMVLVFISNCWPGCHVVRPFPCSTWPQPSNNNDDKPKQ